MFDTLIRETATRFNLGDNAPRFVRMLVDAIFDRGAGGFAGMRQRFDEAGLGDLFASWIGTTPGDNVLQPDQFSAGFGESAAHRIADRLGIVPAMVNMAGAWLLPKVVGMLTRGGVIPGARPAEYDAWFATAAAPAAPAVAPAAATTAYRGSDPVRASGGGWWRWLLGLLLLGLIAFFGFRACSRSQPAAPAVKPPAAAAPAPPAAPAEQGNATFAYANAGGNAAEEGSAKNRRIAFTVGT